MGIEKDLAIEVANLYPPQGEWKEEDYFSLPDTNRYVELSDGRIVMPPHPTFSHQEALKRLFLRLQAFVEKNNLGIVQIAPLPVRLWPGKIREPDIFFIGKEHSDRIGERVCGVPDLVVEVISSSTERTDRIEKFLEYAKAGIREYWLIDPEKKTVEVYSLRGGDYILVGKYSGSQVATSEMLPGFKLRASELFLA
ncbi:MAG: Uma2 family endonuclease [Deltaproteobacteria bacterium]|nr:Uma2 family endonuclease [Deltaproteobacteria bacterium]